MSENIRLLILANHLPVSAEYQDTAGYGAGTLRAARLQ